MQPGELLSQLVDLARAAGLEVREMSGSGGREGDLPTGSGICRVKGGIWILLAGTDSLDERIDVIAGALNAHAGDFLESHYLPPALRERLGGDLGSP